MQGLENRIETTCFADHACTASCNTPMCMHCSTAAAYTTSGVIRRS
jgi:hypothetical protein